MVRCRMLLRHSDGRVEETDVIGDGPITIGGYWRLPPHADRWWKVVALRWSGEGGTGLAELEPATLPPALLELGAEPACRGEQALAACASTSPGPPSR